MSATGVNRWLSDDRAVECPVRDCGHRFWPILDSNPLEYSKSGLLGTVITLRFHHLEQHVAEHIARGEW